MLVFDLLAMFIFAAAGGLTAVRLNLDIVGVVVLGMTTGMGGGITRDLLIGALPPAALVDWRYLTALMLGGLLSFFFHPALGRLESTINVLDAFGLGLFSVTGALKAEHYHLPMLACALVGVVSGVGGGVLRDVLIGRIPTILRRGELYAIPALAGSAMLVVGYRLHADSTIMLIVAASVVTGWRLLALRNGWQAPLPYGNEPED